MAAARWLPAPVEMHPGGGAAAPAWSGLWLVSRFFASVLIVPTVEELAYRGYLMRRLVGRDFAAIPFEATGVWPLLVSSAVFGAAHGAMWPAAVGAGLVYGLLAMRTGRLGEAVCAHATTNALIALAVVFGNHWELW